VNEALVKALEKGTSFGAPCELEVSSICTHQAPSRPPPADDDVLMEQLS
jgi:hypothetical protein